MFREKGRNLTVVNHTVVIRVMLVLLSILVDIVTITYPFVVLRGETSQVPCSFEA